MTAAIFFDLDGTLITYPEDFRDLFEESIGAEVSDDVFDAYVDRLFQSIENLEDSPYEKAFKEAEKFSSIDFNPVEASERYIDIEIAATKRNNELFSLMKELSRKHSIGILTNGEGSVQRRKLEKHNISKHVDEIIISNEIGARKPDAEIFQFAKKQITSKQYIYIGDTFEEDIKPAKKQDFKTIYISGENEADIQAQHPEDLAKILNILLD